MRARDDLVAGRNQHPNQDANTQPSTMHCPTQEEERNGEEDMNEPELVNPILFYKQSNGRSLSGVVEEQIEDVKKQNIMRGGQTRVRTLIGRGILWEKRLVILHKDTRPRYIKKAGKNSIS